MAHFDVDTVESADRRRAPVSYRARQVFHNNPIIRNAAGNKNRSESRSQGCWPASAWALTSICLAKLGTRLPLSYVLETARDIESVCVTVVTHASNDMRVRKCTVHGQVVLLLRKQPGQPGHIPRLRMGHADISTEAKDFFRPLLTLPKLHTLAQDKAAPIVVGGCAIRNCLSQRVLGRR